MTSASRGNDVNEELARVFMLSAICVSYADRQEWDACCEAMKVRDAAYVAMSRENRIKYGQFMKNEMQELGQAIGEFFQMLDGGDA